MKLYRDDVRKWRTKLRSLSGPIRCEIVERSATEISLLFFVEEPEQGADNIRKELQQLVAQPGTHEAWFAAGIGSLALHADEIPRSYEQAAQALRYTFLDGIGSIVDYDAIRLRTEEPAIAYEPLENALRSGDIPAIEQFIEEFADALRRNTLSLEAVEFALMQVMMVLSKVMIDINSQVRMYAPSFLFQDLRQDTFCATIAVIRERCLQIGGHIRHSLLHHASTMFFTS